MDRNSEQEFDMRVVLQVSADESRRLLDTDAGSEIGPNRAIYYDEDRAGKTEKFRPYDLPNAEQIDAWGNQLRTKS